MLEVVDSIDRKKWSEFVRNHPQGNIFQTPEMEEVYRNTKNYEPVSLSVIDDATNKILAVLLAVVIKETELVGSFSARSIIQGGPLSIEGEKGIKALKILMEHYDKRVQKKALYTQIRNIWDTSQIWNDLNNIGYIYSEHLNFLINLDTSESNLWAKLSKSRRYGINKAKRYGVSIEEITDENLIKTIYPQLKDTYKKAKLPLVDISLFESAFKILAPKNMIKIFTAKYESEYIGTIILLTFKETIYDWYASAFQNYLHLYPNDILAWHAITEGSKNSYRVFDFGGAGKPTEYYGVREFKKQFGGELVNFGRFEKIYSPIKMKIVENGFKIYKKLVI